MFIVPLAMGLVGVAIVGMWIRLAWVVWKKKTGIFPDAMEPEIVERRLTNLKIWVLIAGVSLVVGVVGTVLHNALSALVETEEEPVSFFIAFAALLVFIVSTVVSLVMFLRRRRKTP